MNKNNPHYGGTLEELEAALNLSEDQKSEITLYDDLLETLILARKQQGITQRKLAELSGVNQAAIARLERTTNAPQINTLSKILKPLGYKLAIVPEDTPSMVTSIVSK